MASPNMFYLSGTNIHVTYTTSGIDGKAHLSYQDATRSLSFTGEDIEAVETNAGTIVTVSIVRTVDTGYTSFSFLLPEVNVEPIGVPWPVHTKGFTVIHRIGGLTRGQLNTITSVALHGSAEIVEF